jgi:hypothetical protein
MSLSLRALTAAAAAAAAAGALAGCGVNSDVAQAREPSGAQVANAQVDHSDLFLRGVYVQPDASGGPVVVATIVDAAARGSDRLTGVSMQGATRVVPMRGDGAGSSPSSSPSPTSSPSPSSSSSASPSSSASASPSSTASAGSHAGAGASPTASPSATITAAPYGQGSSASPGKLKIVPRATLVFVDPTVGHAKGLVLQVMGVKQKLVDGTAVRVTFTFADAGSQRVLAPVVAHPGTTKVHSENGA